MSRKKQSNAKDSGFLPSPVISSAVIKSVAEKWADIKQPDNRGTPPEKGVFAVAVTRLIDAINAHQNGEVSLFYVNKEKTTKVLKSAGNPIPRGLSSLDGFVNSIRDAKSPVKKRIGKVM